MKTKKEDSLFNASTIILSLLCLIAFTPFAVAFSPANPYALYVGNTTGNNSTTFFDVSGNGRNMTIEGNPQFYSYAGYGINTTNHTAATRVYEPFGSQWALGGIGYSSSFYGYFVPTSGATNWGTIFATSFNISENVTTCQMNVGSTGVFACGTYNGSSYINPKSITISNDGLPHSFVYTISNTNTTTLTVDGNVAAGTASPHTGSAQRSYIGQRTDNSEPFNGTVTWLGMVQRVVTAQEILDVKSMGYNFLNATTYDLYVNITISNSTIRAIPKNFRGAHTAEALENPAYSSGLRNHALDLAVVDTTKIKVYRKDYDFANFAPTYSGNPNAPLVFSTTFGSNYNITAVKVMVTEAAARGIKVHFVDDGPTRWGADNSSKCTYGSNAPDFNYTSCDWANNTIHANAITQFWNAVGCDVNPGTCVHEGRNEAYLAQGTTLGAAAGVFYYRNNTVTCAQRVSGQMKEWNETFPLLKANGSSFMEFWSPAFNYGYHPCGVNMSNQFMAEHPSGGNWSPDFMNDHEYSAQNPPDLDADLALAEAAFTAGSYGSKWGISESGLNNDPLNQNSQSYQGAALMSYIIYAINSTTIQRQLYFEFDGGESYIIYNSSVPTILYPGKVLNATKWSDEVNGTAKACTTTNPSVTCAFIQSNNSKGVLLIANRNNNSVLIQNITYTGTNITAAASNTNTTTFTVSSGKASNVGLAQYGIDGYNLTLNSADTTPPVVTSISNFTNASMLQVNFSCDESCNASINFGITTSLGNKTNNTAYQSSHSFNITGLAAGTRYFYNVTVCDVTGNCAAYGTYNASTTSTVTVYSVTINSSTNNRLSDLTAYCAANFTYVGEQTFYGQWWNGSSNYLNITKSSTFYQESPNQTGDDSITTDGTIYAGTQYVTTVNVTTGRYDVTYLKPLYAINVSWSVTAGYNDFAGSPNGRNTTNYSIGNCYNAYSDRIRLQQFSTFSTFTSQELCYDSGFVVIGSNSRFGIGRTIQTTTGTELYDGNNATGAAFDSGAWNIIGSGVNDATLFEEGVIWYRNFSGGNVNVSTINSSLIRKGENWTYTCGLYNGAFNSSFVNSSVFTIGNVVPNATNVLITNGTANVTCAYTFADYDNDAEAGSTYKWYKNGSLLGSVNKTLTNGNYSVGSNLTCEVTPKDGTGFGTAVNSSAFIVGDSTPPSLFSPSIQSTASTTDLVAIAVSCSDENSVANGYPTVSWTNPVGAAEGAYSMTSVGSTQYVLYHQFTTAGLYSNFSFFCRDGNSNNVTLVTASTMLVSPGSSSSGGGGGGGGGGNTVVNVSFTSNIGLISQYAFLLSGDLHPTKVYDFSTNRDLKSCEIIPTENGGAFSCFVSKSRIKVTVDLTSAREPLSSVYEATIIAHSTTGEAVSIPVRVSVFSFEVVDANGNLWPGKTAELAFGAAAIAFILYNMFKKKRRRVRVRY